MIASATIGCSPATSARSSESLIASTRSRASATPRLVSTSSSAVPAMDHSSPLAVAGDRIAPADVVRVGDTLTADVAGARAAGITRHHPGPLRPAPGLPGSRPPPRQVAIRSVASPCTLLIDWTGTRCGGCGGRGGCGVDLPAPRGARPKSTLDGTLSSSALAGPLYAPEYAFGPQSSSSAGLWPLNSGASEACGATRRVAGLDAGARVQSTPLRERHAIHGTGHRSSRDDAASVWIDKRPVVNLN